MSVLWKEYFINGIANVQIRALDELGFWRTIADNYYEDVEKIEVGDQYYNKEKEYWLSERREWVVYWADGTKTEGNGVIELFFGVHPDKTCSTVILFSGNEDKVGRLQEKRGRNWLFWTDVAELKGARI